jgi:hypothetical protein
MMQITLKLFGGLDRDLGITGYNPAQGVQVSVKRGTRFWRVLRIVGLKKRRYYSFIRRGEDVGLFTRLEDGDEIHCFKPVGGG